MFVHSIFGVCFLCTALWFGYWWFCVCVCVLCWVRIVFSKQKKLLWTKDYLDGNSSTKGCKIMIGVLCWYCFAIIFQYLYFKQFQSVSITCIKPARLAQSTTVPFHCFVPVHIWNLCCFVVVDFHIILITSAHLNTFFSPWCTITWHAALFETFQRRWEFYRKNYRFLLIWVHVYFVRHSRLFNSSNFIYINA